MLSLIMENPVVYKMLLKMILLAEIIALSFSVCAGWLGRTLLKDEFQPLNLSSRDYVTACFVGGVILGNLGILICFGIRCSCQRESCQYNFKFKEFAAYLFLTGPLTGLFGAKILYFNLHNNDIYLFLAAGAMGSFFWCFFTLMMVNFLMKLFFNVEQDQKAQMSLLETNIAEIQAYINKQNFEEELKVMKQEIQALQHNNKENNNKEKKDNTLKDVNLQDQNNRKSNIFSYFMEK